MVWWWLVACSDPSGSAAVPSAATKAERVAPEPNAANQIIVRDARVRAVPPGTPHSAAFLVLENAGDAVKLHRAKADVSKRVELHTHRPDEDGVMQMRPISGIEVPAKGSVVLEPGGLHLMLTGLKSELEVGEGVGLTLIFDDKSELSIVAPVVDIRKVPAKATAEGHDHGDATDREE